MGDMSRPVSGLEPGPELAGIPKASCAGEKPARVAKVRSLPATRERTAAEVASRAADEAIFIELRRKVQDGEVLSTSTERLLWKMKFSGRLTVVVQNGRAVKSGYEEGYFRRKNDFGGLLIKGI